MYKYKIYLFYCHSVIVTQLLRKQAKKEIGWKRGQKEGRKKRGKKCLCYFHLIKLDVVLSISSIYMSLYIRLSSYAKFINEQ